MPSKPLKLMVASTVYHFENELNQICAVLNGFGYKVLNSHLGTIPPHPGKSNMENCLKAVEDCDVFLGIIRPFYGSGVIGPRSITHEEFRKAIELKKPRWFLVHRDVTFARQLLKPYMFRKNKTRTKFKLKRNSVMDDIRVIDIYNDAILNDVSPADRKGNWVQEFHDLSKALEYLDTLFKDTGMIRRVCREMRPT